jgi:transmembrane sensor
MKKREQIWIRMARYMAGEMNMKEEIAFRDHLEHNVEQHSELIQMEQSWKYINEYPSQGERDTGKAWDKLYKRLEADGLLDEQVPERVNPRLLPALRIAASILLILAIGIPAVYLGYLRNATGGSVDRYHSEKGVSTVDLPDGSRVFLNQGAEITCPHGFEQERTVELRGEAFFEVMSDPVNPFTVRSGNVVVSVLGTSFNVKRMPETDDVEVYVESGKVRMSLEGSGEFITLEPGDMGLAEGTRLVSSELSDPNYISWKTKDFKFVDEELVKVLRELEESYHVVIHTDGVEPGEMRITTTYREQSIDAILETIGTAFGLTVSKKEEHYYLKK